MIVSKAVLSNSAHPEYGQATIPLPIPREQYDHCVELLGELGIGDPVARDCRLDELWDTWPVLDRLQGGRVNLDELDYLIKRLDGFDVVEIARYQAMAQKLELTDMTDLINLTFCCQQATVITDFSDLAAVGRDHYMNTHGGCAKTEELEQLDGEETAILLIEDNEGTVTRYGVVYDNGMRLEPVYDGRHLPAYSYAAGGTERRGRWGTLQAHHLALPARLQGADPPGVPAFRHRRPGNATVPLPKQFL